MVRHELLLKLVEKKPHLTPGVVKEAIDTIFGEIAAALSRGDRVELRGFGSFTTRQRPARVGRNPMTGAKVEVEAKRFPHFKPGTQMRTRLNG